LPVFTFCEKRAGKKISVQVTVTPETTLGEAICKVVDARVHRAWIVVSTENDPSLSNLPEKLSSLSFAGMQS